MKSLAHLLDPRIHSATRENARLMNLFSQCMPPEALKQVLFARIEGNTLKVTTGNSAWAARIRFYSRDLLYHTARVHPAVRLFSVHVLPTSGADLASRESKRGKPEVAPQVASRIGRIADDMDEGELSVALNKLARNLAGDA